MPQQPHLAALYHHYVGILQPIPSGTVFTSHWFIERLAQANQQEYITALNAYIRYYDAFRRLHAPLSKRLYQHRTFVDYVGHAPSPDIFGDMEDCAEWRRR